ARPAPPPGDGVSGRERRGMWRGGGGGQSGVPAPADPGPPAGEIDVAAAKLAADIERGQSDPLQPNRIESHPDLPPDAADALDAGDAADPLQLTDDYVLDEERELLGRLSGSDRRIGENGESAGIDASNQGLVDPARW